MKKMKSVFNVLIIMISILLIVLNAIILYNKFILKKDLMSFGGYSMLVVVSGSMEPEIETDDLIIIKKVDEYEENDIVTYQKNNHLITHRIVRIEEDKIYTKGDHNNTEDEPITADCIQGKVVKNVKAIGKLWNTHIITTAIVIILVIYFIAVILKK